jgi:anti-sigma28 factor (negative regulator of flagellin synthesis)
MTDIGFLNNTPLEHGTQIPGRAADPVQGVGTGTNSTETGGPRLGPVDQVEISQESRELDRHLSAMKRLPLVREEKIAQARAAIDEGRFDTNEALSQALEIMIEEAQAF